MPVNAIKTMPIGFDSMPKPFYALNGLECKYLKPFPMQNGFSMIWGAREKFGRRATSRGREKFGGYMNNLKGA
jgi:hypothetical protein